MLDLLMTAGVILTLVVLFFLVQLIWKFLFAIILLVVFFYIVGKLRS